MKISFRSLPYLAAALFTGVTPTASVFFGILDIPIPSYLLITIVSIGLIVCVLCFSDRAYLTRLNYLSFSLLVFLMVSTYSYVNAGDYVAPETKIVSLFYLVFIPLFMISILFMSSRHDQANDLIVANQIYFKIYTYSAALFLVFLFLFRSAGDNGRIVLPGLENPIWISRHIGAALLVYFAHIYLSQKEASFKRILFCLLLLFALFYSGSRAPLIACLVTGLLFVLSQKGFSKLKLLVTVGAVTLVYMLASVFLNNYVFDTGFYSVYDRLKLWTFILDLPISFLGHGLSSFGRVYIGEDVNYYPHNFLAEMYFEYGIIGIFFAALVVLSVLRTYGHSIAGALALFYLINSMASGDLPNNGSLLLSVFVALKLHYFPRKRLSGNPPGN